MTVTVKKLIGEEIPVEERVVGIDEVFRVTGVDGRQHFCTDDVEAAKLAVTLSASTSEPLAQDEA